MAEVNEAVNVEVTVKDAGTEQQAVEIVKEGIFTRAGKKLDAAGSKLKTGFKKHGKKIGTGVAVVGALVAGTAAAGVALELQEKAKQLDSGIDADPDAIDIEPEDVESLPFEAE